MLDDLAADVTAALTGKLRPATLWKYDLVDDGTGDVTVIYGPPHECEGLRGSFESVLAGLSGIPRTDARIELLAASLAVTPGRMDVIEIDGGWWSISDVEVDPAGAVWICQCAATSPVT